MVYLPGLFVTLKIEMKHCIVGYHTQCSLHLLNVEGHMSIQCMQNIYILVCPVLKLSTAESVLYFNIFSGSLLQSSVSRDPSEFILIC